jgi:hypothetical protein
MSGFIRFARYVARMAFRRGSVLPADHAHWDRAAREWTRRQVE